MHKKLTKDDADLNDVRMLHVYTELTPDTGKIKSSKDCFPYHINAIICNYLVLDLEQY